MGGSICQENFNQSKSRIRFIHWAAKRYEFWQYFKSIYSIRLLPQAVYIPLICLKVCLTLAVLAYHWIYVVYDPLLYLLCTLWFSEFALSTWNSTWNRSKVALPDLLLVFFGCHFRNSLIQFQISVEKFKIYSISKFCTWNTTSSSSFRVKHDIWSLYCIVAVCGFIKLEDILVYVRVRALA